MHTLYAQKAMCEVDPGSVEGEKTKEMALKLLQANGWSRFISDGETRRHIIANHGDEGVFLDVARAAEKIVLQIAGSKKGATGKVGESAVGGLQKTAVESLVEEDLVKSTEALNRLMVHSMEFLKRQCKVFGVVDYGRARFYSDVGHAAAVGMDIRVMCCVAENLLDERLKTGRKIRLGRDSSLMVVEDNPLHHLFFQGAYEAKNLRLYAPNKKKEPTFVVDPVVDRMYTGFYQSAEDALRIIDENVASGGKPPDFIITDIELAGRMNGIELVRKVHEKYPKTVVFMVYSSNFERYVRETESGLPNLLQEDYLIGGWNKADFTFEKAVDVMNERIWDRSLIGRSLKAFQRFWNGIFSSEKPHSSPGQ